MKWYHKSIMIGIIVGANLAYLTSGPSVPAFEGGLITLLTTWVVILCVYAHALWLINKRYN